MPSDIGPQDIQGLLTIAGVTGFTGQYTPIGGGEGNDTFVLDCGATKLVLRIARYSGVDNLANEARALGLLNLDQVPKLVYFGGAQRIHGRAWIVESHMDGTQVERLDTRQLENLGGLLAISFRLMVPEIAIYKATGYFVAVFRV